MKCEFFSRQAVLRVAVAVAFLFSVGSMVYSEPVCSPSGDTSTQTQSSEELTREQLENLFLRPLGISEDIRDLNRKKFEKALKNKGIYFTSWKSQKTTYYDFPGRRVNVAGVMLPVSVWLDEKDKSVQVIYWGWKLPEEEREQLRQNVRESANRIAQLFRDRGFTPTSWPGSDTVDAFKLQDRTVFIEIDSSNDLEMGVVMYYKD